MPLSFFHWPCASTLTMLWDVLAAKVFSILK
jgi:hypothetical protein